MYTHTPPLTHIIAKSTKLECARYTNAPNESMFWCYLLKNKRPSTNGVGGDLEGAGLSEDASLGVVDRHGHDVPVAGQEAVRSAPHPRA